ncbi:MAG: CoA ester lyase [Solirubrobacterales bacterium]|nr:CoA ester lyase [Solirubrobacterales bacterium]
MRSLLFAPAGRADLVAKLPRSRPDAAIIDLEDAVPPAHKEDARSALASLVGDLLADAPGLATYVRVNAPGTSWFPDDVEALPAGLAGIVVPKLEHPEQLTEVSDALVGAGRDGLAVIAGLETARGILDVRDLLGGPVTAAYFGAEDYIADLGGVRSAGAQEVLYARSRVALACRVAGVLALDQVVVDIHDADAFRADAARGRALGYRGKLCIHPSQVALAREAFTPSHEEVAAARELLAEAEGAAADGRGAIVVAGAMVDEPMLRTARDVVARAGDGST